MRKIYILFILSFLSFAANAQNRYFTKGYEGNIGLVCDSDFTGFTTSHGARFGNGLYIGGTLGVDVLGFMDGTPSIPIMAEFRCHFLKNSTISPYVSAGLGGGFSLSRDFEPFSFLSQLNVGVSVDSWSIFVGAKANTLCGQMIIHPQLGVSWHFPRLRR